MSKVTDVVPSTASAAATLIQAGWVPQDSPGLWRHPFAPDLEELTTMQALQVQAERRFDNPADLIW